MRNKDWNGWKCCHCFLSTTHANTQRNVVPNRAAQGALMSVSLGMLSSPLPPLYSSLSLPLSFFLLFSLQFLTAGRSTGQNEPVYGAKKIFPIVIGKKWCVMNHDDNCTILLQTCYRWKWDAVFLLINLLYVWKNVYLKMNILSSYTPHNCVTFFCGTKNKIFWKMSP